MCASCFRYHERFKATRGHCSVLTDKLQSKGVLDPKTHHVPVHSNITKINHWNFVVRNIWYFLVLFLAQNNSNVLVELFCACFWHFKFLTQTDHFAKAMAFTRAIAFARWPIFKILSFPECLVFFRAVFCTEQHSFPSRIVFSISLAFLIFDPKRSL